MYCVHLTGVCFGFFVVQDSFATSPNERRYIFVFTFTFTDLQGPKSYKFKTWMVYFAITFNLLFYKRLFECLEEILTKAKSKWKLEWNIFLFMHLKSFTSHFDLVWNWRMCSRFFQCWFPHMFVDRFDFNLDANNVQRLVAKFFPRFYYYLKHLKHVHYDCHG